MSLDERARTGRGLDAVSEIEVIRYWLGEEVDEGDDEIDPDAIDTEPALREELFERMPIAEHVFTAGDPPDWYRVELSEDELRDLRVVVGEHHQDWRALAEDDRVESIAERVRDADDLATLDERTPKDLEEVDALADRIDSDGPQGPLVVVKDGDDPAYVADGNHRAVAHVLHLLRGGEFTGRDAYLGVRK